MMGDDHGWAETGYYNHPHLKTPVLDEMASRGLRMDNFYAAHPTCSPTRGSFLTARHPNRYGTFTPNCSMRPEEITIAQVLSSAGYACGHFGKWHVGPVKASSPTSPGAMGFATWLSHDNFFELDPILSRDGGPPKKYPGESSQVIVDQTKQFIEQSVRDGKPTLSVVWFGSPHEPYSGLEPDLELYDDLPSLYADKQVRLTSNETGRPTRRPQGDVLRERYAEITAMDRAIGDLRDFLDQQGIRQNTLLLYCGDNGTPQEGQLKSPLRGRKGTVYEGGVRVPGVVEWPAVIQSPRQSKFTATTSDLLPTLCNIVGCELPDRPLDGVDLLPVFQGQATRRTQPAYFWSFGAEPKDAEPYIDPELQKGTTPLVKLMGSIATRNFHNSVFTETNQKHFTGARAMIDGDFKLVIDDRSGTAQYELFDLSSDLGETTNLAAEHPELVNEMQGSFRAWQSSVLNSLLGKDY
jgi:arylsulfatase A-like enzyme